MNGLIATLLDAPVERVLFGTGITAGRIRAVAADAIKRIEKREGPVFIFTESAALCTAALLAAAVARRTAILLPQVQPGYLAEISCEPDALLNDATLSFNAADASLSWAPWDTDILFYTSGSTGRAKAVEKKLSQIEAEARMWERGWSADAGDVLATVSHQHIYGLIFRVVWPVLSGRISSDRAAIAWEELEGALGVRSTFITSPAHLTRLPPSFAFADGGPPKLVFSSGGLLPLPAAREAAALFGLPVMEVLGSTETGGVAWRRRTDDAERWRAFEGVEISAGEEGLMRVRSAFAGAEPVDMGDIVKIDGDGAFSLVGRGDRVAKVEGKRVSLPAVEMALKALPDVADAAVLTLDERDGALAAVVALSPTGRDALDVHGAFRLSRVIRRDLAASLEPAERPKHWRFVDEIQTNAQSKRVLSDLAALFGEPSPFDLLDCEVLEQSADAARIRIRLEASLPWFEGHFPDRPILPGIAQVHIAAGLGEKLLGFWPVGGGLTRVKFRRVLRPNDVVILSLKRDAKADRLEFVYAFGEIDASQGVIGG